MMILRPIFVVLLTIFRSSEAFAPTKSPRRPVTTQLFEKETDECWNPKLRKSLGTIASLGIAETSYLTAAKVFGTKVAFCGASGSCGSVLDSPYAYVPGTEIPLSSLGLIAYSTVAYLALEPVVTKRVDDEQNRILLTAATTTMGVFSVFLMTFLFGVLHQSCNFCIASAAFSIILAKLCWLGGSLPKDSTKEGIKWSLGGGLTAFATAFVLFATGDVPDEAVNFAGERVNNDMTLLAEGKAPPPILSQSSPRALELANRLESMDAKMFGAYWCSHCYDQKEIFGKEAFRKINYIECSKEGSNSQTGLCKDSAVPGYPTWSIGGKLYPGEKDLEELEEIVNEISGKPVQG